MYLESVVISVYDTNYPNNTGAIPVDYAERGSCKLIYEGDDDRMVPVMASRLEFSLEVDIEESKNTLVYKQLFTGEEFRFKVVVTDQDDAVIWVGFLLPDEYNEPFTTGTFYVNFTATDGLGKLKGQEINNPVYYPQYTFYRSRHSITKILGDCLLLTGLDLDMYLSPALENLGAGERMDKVFLHGGTWYGNGSPEKAYTILEDVLNEFGLVLYQQLGRWYVIGYNKRSIETPSWLVYDSSGVYQETVTEPDEVTGQHMDFNATPDISLHPPFREVIVSSGVEDQGADMFPEDIVRQTWVKTEEPQSPPDPKYWQGVGGTTAALYNDRKLDDAEFTGDDIKITSAVGGDIIYSDATQGQMFATYIELKNTPFLSGGNGETLSVKFDYAVFFLDISLFNYLTFVSDDTIVFDIKVAGATIMSNKPGYSYRDAFRLSFKEDAINGYARITGHFEIENFPVPHDGFLEVRFHHPGDIDFISLSEYFVVYNLEIKYDRSEIIEFKRRRLINFTKTHELTIANGDSILQTALQSVLYQDLISPGEFSEIIISSAGYRAGYGDLIYFASETDYNTAVANSDRLYLQRYKSDFPEFIEDIEFYTIVDGGTYYAARISFFDGHAPISLDSLLIRSATPGRPYDGTTIRNREKWRNTSFGVLHKRLGYALCELIHNVNAESSLMIEGTTRWVLFPGDRVIFPINGIMLTWIPLRIEIALGENETKITAIETKDSNIYQYE